MQLCKLYYKIQIQILCLLYVKIVIIKKLLLTFSTIQRRQEKKHKFGCTSQCTSIFRVLLVPDLSKRAKMGIWDFISSGAESVKRNTPDLATPVTKVCKGTYYYSATAVKMIDNVVRVSGVQKLGQYSYMPDEEGRAKIVSFSTKFAKNASVYAIKESAKIFLPGLLPSHFTKSDFVINFSKKRKI